MSFYYEASGILANERQIGGSLKSRVFNGSKDLKTPPAKLYALLIESLKWSPYLKEVIERSEILKFELKLDARIVVLLVHDLLLSKSGIVANPKHVLRITVEKHKNRLRAELTKCRIRHGFASIEEMRKHINGFGLNEEKQQRYPHPRWVRINTLKVDSGAFLQENFSDYERSKSGVENVIKDSSQKKLLAIDRTIPNLIVLPSGSNVAKIAYEAYDGGQIILQDKASCFPAQLLDPSQCDGDIIDACAAPGNKTTHLAALLACAQGDKSNTGDVLPRKVFAFERDRQRSHILKKMVTKAGADEIVTIFANTDFLSVDPNDSKFSNVGALLLDPSCSGTGIVGRDDELKMQLPEAPANGTESKSKKRKRSIKPAAEPVAVQDEEVELQEVEEGGKSFAERLIDLSAFQLLLIEHSMRFPKATRITYSTCSTHFEENEAVVVKALASKIAQDMGWRIMLREDQPKGLQDWPIRGLLEHCAAIMQDCRDVSFLNTPAEVADACICCEKGTKMGTMGFFVAGFVRDEKADGKGAGNNVEDEWTGFSDGEE